MTRPAVRTSATEQATAAVEPLLARYRQLTLDALFADLPQQSPEYLYELLQVYPSRPGKGLRAALCLATCAAFGGAVERAINSAVAIELFHNAFLIHDDIQDASELRRGQPTLQSLYGPAIALNVGNATNLLALQRIRANRAILGSSVAWQVFEETETMLRHSVEGQALELGWIRDNAAELVDDDYYRMCLKKTSWYTCVYPCRLGLLVAAGGRRPDRVLDRYGWYLGAAFQIHDDLLNLTGDYQSYGKEILGDLREGKRTLMVIHLQRTLGGADAERFRAFLGQSRRERRDADVEWVHKLLTECGSIDSARTKAAELAHEARCEAERALAQLPDSDDKSFLLGLADYVITRAS